MHLERKLISMACLMLAMLEVGCAKSETPNSSDIIITSGTIYVDPTTTCTTSLFGTTSTIRTTSATLTTTTTTVMPRTEEIPTTVTEAPTPEIIEIPTEIVQEPAPAEPVAGYSESDAILLAKLINAEASVYYDGKVAVGSCVLNRANANGLSISDVIYAPGQFTTVGMLSYYTQADYDAAVQVLTYGSSDTRIYYFNGNHGGLNWFYDANYNYLYAG